MPNLNFAEALVVFQLEEELLCEARSYSTHFAIRIEEILHLNEQHIF